MLVDRASLLIITDKGYIPREPDILLAERGTRLLRPSYRNRTPHPAQHPQPVRQLIESLKGEPHGGRIIDGVTGPRRPTSARTERRGLA